MIEFHGDSTQFGSIVNDETPIRSAFIPSETVGRLLGVETSNFGVPGSTLDEALNNPIYPGGRTFAQHIALSSATVIVANWGINDSFVVGVTAANQKARWESLRDICAGAGKALIIETPNPINFGQQALLAEMADASKTITGVGVADTMAHVLGYFDDWPNAMDNAGVHPQDRLYIWIGVRLARDIERILE